MLTPIGQTNFRNKVQKFGIQTDDRRRHMYAIGQTGTGKSVLLKNMIINDIQSGKGVAFIDPHGDSAEAILNFIPKDRIDDVIYFNPGDLNYPIAFNAIEEVPLEYRHIMADGIVGVFKKIWADSWGPRLEYVLRNAINALLEYPNSTLLGVMRLLTNKEYRNKVVATITDPIVKDFWVEEYAKYPDRFQSEAVAPIQNKVGQFLTNFLIRNIIGQPRSAFNMRELIDQGKILIMNLSKGRMGEGASALLGAMMITKLQLAAMSRVDIPNEEDRKDFFLYVDEFQNFATESFANILSEARKYHLNLILAHQYIAQLPDPVRDAVFGNVGTLISFRVGATDAEFLEKEFSPEFVASDLVGLANYKIYLRLMINGVNSRPFSADTLPPYPKPETSYSREIIELSRKKYATPREDVEMEIVEWSSESSEERAKIEKEEGPRPYSVSPEGISLYNAVCANCGKDTKVTFQPKEGRPVFCKKCREKKKKADEEARLEKIRPREERQEREEFKNRDPIFLRDLRNREEKRNFPPRPRREVNINSLRSTLRESLGLKDK